MITTISSIQSPRDNIRILKIQKPDGFDYQAGQYILISFNEMPVRPYSIACASEQDVFEIHIKDNQGQTTSYIMNELKEGDSITIQGPFGNMVYVPDSENNDKDAPIVLVAGGLGITPMKAILEAAIKDNHRADILLYWGTADKDDFYLDGYVEKLTASHNNFQCIKVCPEPVGTFAAKQLAENTKEQSEILESYKIYIAGSKDMIENTQANFTDIGAKKSNIYYDTFELPTI